MKLRIISQGKDVITTTRHHLVIEFVDPTTGRKSKVKKTMTVKHDDYEYVLEGHYELFERVADILAKNQREVHGPWWQWANVTSKELSLLPPEQAIMKRERLESMRPMFDQVFFDITNNLLEAIGQTRQSLNVADHHVSTKLRFPLTWDKPLKPLPPNPPPPQERQKIAIEEVSTGDL